MNATDLSHMLISIVIVAGLIVLAQTTKANNIDQQFKDKVGITGPNVDPKTIPSQITVPSKPTTGILNTNISTQEDLDKSINYGKVAKTVRQNKDGSLDLE